MLIASLKRLKTFLLYLFLLGIYAPLFAQSFLTDARLFSEEDGLSGRYITDVQEDHQGFIWISTWLGLNRFDGFEFKKYPKEDYGLRHNKYEHLLIDPKGNIWLAQMFNNTVDAEMQLQIDVFNPITEQLIHEELFADASFKIETIQAIKNDQDDNIWIGLQNGEIYKYDGSVFQKIINVPIFFKFEIISDHICILPIEKNEIQFYDLENNLLEKYNLTDSIVDFFPNPAGGVILLSKRNFQNTNKAIWTKYHPTLPKESFEFTTKNETPIFDTLGEFKYLFKIDQQQNIWVSSNATIALFDKNYKLIHDFNNDIPNGQVAGNNFFLDKQNRIWASTSTGVFTLHINKNIFENYLGTDNLVDTRGMAEDSFGNIYINQSNTFYLNTKTNKIEKTKLKSSRGLFFASNGKLYCGNYHPVIYEYDPETEQIKSFSLPVKNITGSRFGASNFFVQGENKNLIYIGTSKKGLYVLDLEQQQIFPFLKTNEFDWLQNAGIICYKKDKYGIWLGTSNGLVLLNEEKGIRRHYPLTENPNTRIRILSLHIDDEENFWAGTFNNGLYKYESSTQQITNFTTEDGLTDNTVYAIYEDKKGFLWLSSNQGLMQMDKATLEIKTYSPSDGIPHKEFNATSHLQASDGRLYFGGLRGVTAFYPEEIHQQNTNSKSFSPIVSEISTLDGETGNWKIITQTFQENQSVELKSKNPNLQIQLIAMDILHPEKNQYTYRLHEKEDWSYAEKNILTLKNLPYGNSNIQIRGRVQNGEWSEQPLKISILRHHPFYLKAPFIIGVLLLIGLIGFYMRKRNQKSKTNREHKIKEAISTIKESMAPSPKEETFKPTPSIETLEDKLPTSAADEWLKVLNKNANQLIDDGKFSIIELAESMNLSERQFRRRLKQKTDMVPKAYLNEIRLQKAKQLLMSGAHPTVAQVCYAVGFSTPKHFSKIFLERFGNNPSFYLNKNSGNQNS